jgi:hypothetical protein
VVPVKNEAASGMMAAAGKGEVHLVSTLSVPSPKNKKIP